MSLTTAPPVIDLSLYIPDLKSKKRDAALAEMAGLACSGGLVRDADLLVELLRVRERAGGTAIGKGVALPHARSLTVMKPQLVVARSTRGIDWSAPDEQPVQLILMSLVPADWTESAFHGFVARAAAVARIQKRRQKLLAADTREALAVAFREALA